MISKKLYYFLSFTWGLPLTLVGCIVALVLLCLGYRPEKFCYCWHFKVGRKWGGLEFGIIFITDDTPTLHTKCHEFGHGLQNCYWGFLMPFVICIPSAIRYWWREFIVCTGASASLLPPYDSIWFEGDATRRGTEAYQFLNKEKNNGRLY